MNNITLELKQSNPQNSQLQMKIGRAIFKPSFTQKIKGQMISKKMQTQLALDDWSFDNRLYVSQKWHLVFEWILQTFCKKISAIKNLHPNILKDISGTQFSLLIELNLSHNNISNIEALGFLNCQNLQSLNLSHNYIVEVKSFNKTRWKQFEFLNIKRNICIGQTFNRVKIGQVKMKIEYGSKDWNANFNEDISFLIKTETKYILKTCFSSQSRIYQQWVPRVLKKKFPNNSIAYFNDLLIY